MKKDNPKNKDANEEVKHSSGSESDARKEIRARMQEKAAAEKKEKQKKKKYVIAACCCAIGLAAVVGAAVYGIATKKPAAQIAVTSVSSKEAETLDVKVPESDEKEPDKEHEKEQEITKEQSDDDKAGNDKKNTKGEKNKDQKKIGTEIRSVSDMPEKKKAGETETINEAAGDTGETKEPAGTPDPEPAQETPVEETVVTETPPAPVPTQAPQEDIYLPSEPVVTMAPHVHTWQERIRTVHHDAITEEVKVVDQAAYTEPVYEEQPVYETISVYICDVCGEEFENVGEHSETHIDWETFTNPFHYHVEFRQGDQIGTELVQTGSITHPEVSHMETKVISAAYDEQIPEGYVCTGCGAVK